MIFYVFVKQFDGNYKIKTFTCWHQLLYMIFGQLSNRQSLSDLVTCLQSQQNKSYHLGMSDGVLTGDRTMLFSNGEEGA